MPALRLDCGVDDPFLDQNRDLHATLTRLGIAHTYAEYPGKHDWVYWRTHAAQSAAFLLARVSGARTTGTDAGRRDGVRR
jgi:putative tributyrin esterase